MDKAELILFNGNLYTLDPKKPFASAVAVGESRIIMTGDDREIMAVKGKQTEIIDLKGRAVLPGFIDAHTHFIDGGLALYDVQLRDAADKEDFISRIQEKALDLNKGEWILNGDWDHQGFTEPEMPRKEWIDPCLLYTSPSPRD